MIPLAFDQLTKRYGAVTAVDGLTAGIRPGRVTVFLGANGSGKTTSMRALLGLTPPTSGTATIGGRAYRELDHPARAPSSACMLVCPIGQQVHNGPPSRAAGRCRPSGRRTPGGRRALAYLRLP